MTLHVLSGCPAATTNIEALTTRTTIPPTGATPATVGVDIRYVARDVAVLLSRVIAGGWR